MLLLIDTNLILLFIIVITRMSILTSQQFVEMRKPIKIINDSRLKLNQYLHLFDRRTVRFIINSTLKKDLDSNDRITHSPFSIKFSRKKRQSDYNFNSESLKYFTCAVVSQEFYSFILQFTAHIFRYNPHKSFFTPTINEPYMIVISL